MQKKFIITGDGSHSIVIPGLNVTYHSIHGAILESKHVFIEAGLNYLLNNSCSQSLDVFEMGFSTGLNAFLTAIEAQKEQTKIHYTALEQYPLSIEETKNLNYVEHLDYKELFKKIHESEWNENVMISEYFTL